jgi:BMFP domain-containing protein YqiC
MIISITIIILIILAGYWFVFFHDQKIKRIKSNLVLEVDGADIRYPNLPLGNFGIFFEVKENRRIQVIFPKLTPEGIEYIYSWHNLQSIRIPTFEKIDIDKKANLKVAQQLAFLIKEHIQFVEPEILKLRKQWHKINNLLDLVLTSEFYASQQGIYKRALFQIENLLDKAEELQQVYIGFIRELLIGTKVAQYDPNLLPNDDFAIENKYKKIREEYQYMKDTATAYAELLHTSQV